MTLARKALSEYVGTALLVATVIGSGIMATRLSPTDVGLQLLQNSLATSAVLIALILVLQPVSAAFNPVVTLASVVLDKAGAREAVPLVAAQLAGGFSGAVVANQMFDLDAVTLSHTERTGGGLWLGEVVATLGLVLVIFAMARAGREDRIAWGVAGWIVAAYWFTSSTSFANPAVTFGRIFSDTFAGIAPASAPLFVVFQLVGGALGVVLVTALTSPSSERQPA